MSEDKITKEWFDLDQRILFYLTHIDKDAATIQEVSDGLDEPRTTVSEHLKYLSSQGFLSVEKEGRTKKYSVKEQIQAEIEKGLTELRSTYITALDSIKQKELEELKDIDGN